MADLILSTNKAYSNAELIRVRQDDYGQTITALITDKTNSPIDLSKAEVSFNVKDWSGDVISDKATGDVSGNATYAINKSVAFKSWKQQKKLYKWPIHLVAFQQIKRIND